MTQKDLRHMIEQEKNKLEGNVMEKNKCEYCNKELDGSGCAWDYNWLYGAQDPGKEVPREKMDLYYFCDQQCLVKWQKQEGIYDAAKKKSIERSGSDTQI